MEIKNTLENYLSLYNQHARNIWQEFDDDELDMFTRIFDRYVKVVDDFLQHILKTKDLNKAMNEWLYHIWYVPLDWYMNVSIDNTFISYKI